MDIFESLENLNVSEECFNDIVGLVEEYINELDKSTIQSYISKRDENAKDAEKKFEQAKKQGVATRELLNDYLTKLSKAQYAKQKGGEAMNYSASMRHHAKKNLAK